MEALVWTGSRLAAFDDVEVRAPLAGEVTVRIDYAGLCHSDLKPIEGHLDQPVPVILGHEASGVVVDRGPDVSLPVGQRVVLSPLRSCGRCRHCLVGRPTLCTTLPASPAPSVFSRGGEPVSQFVRIGAFARHTVVGEAQVVPVPEEVPAPVAALLGCAVVTGFGAVWGRAKLEQGESALVIGAGGIGLNAVQAAKLAGASRIVVCDTNPRKEEIAFRFGATEFHLVAGADEIRKLVPEDVDVALECVGRADLTTAAIDVLGAGGRVVMVGLPPSGTEMTFGMRELFQDKAILGCRMGSVDPHTFIPDLARRYLAGELLLDPLITTVVPLSAGEELVAQLQSGALDRGLFDLTGATR